MASIKLFCKLVMINLDPLHNFGRFKFLSSMIDAPTFSASLWSGNPESLMKLKNSMG